MKGFKLIAIRPLEKCSSKFSKILTNGEIYRFYNNYEFILKDSNIHSDVAEVKYTPNGLDELFEVITEDKALININISAVVGGNGSGKSTLLELLYMTTYLISTKLDIIKTKSNVKYENDGKRLKKSSIDDDTKKNIDFFLKSVQKIKDPREYINGLHGIGTEINSLLENDENYANDEKNKALNELVDIEKELKLEIYYSIDESLYKLTILDDIELKSYALQERKEKDNKISYFFNTKSKGKLLISNKKIASAIKNESITKLLQELFYSIVTNYSIHGLNQNNIGLWIKSLFHKNDGYVTPIVLNPYRNNGNIDINREMAFAKHRLLNNIMIQYRKSKEDILITDKQHVEGVVFKLNLEKQRNIYKANYKKNIDLIYLLEKFSGDKFNDEEGISSALKSEVKMYINNKYGSIYEKYGALLDYDDDDVIKIDDSHIFFKLMQAINFLLRNHKLSKGLSVDQELADCWKEKSKDGVYFSIENLAKWMNLEFLKVDEIIKHLPPAIFEIDFVLSKENSNDKSDCKFDSLSSGEQQLIHSTNSVLYHLNNLQSIYHGSTGRLTYDSINIIFDEIELYFHPEYQRKFISRLLESVSRMRFSVGTGFDQEGEISRIKNINILFVTHSPFILSDIPKSNCLFLDVEDKKVKVIKDYRDVETFGANIYDTLKKGFFLKNGLIGEYTNKKIKRILKYSYEIKIKDINNSITDANVHDYMNEKSFNENLVNNIGDHYIRKIMKNHLNEISRIMDSKIDV